MIALTHVVLSRRVSGGRGEIPTLGQVCDLVDGAELFVEIKGAGIERDVDAALRAYAGPVAIHSFDTSHRAARAARWDVNPPGLLSPEDGSLVWPGCQRLTARSTSGPTPLVDEAMVAEVTLRAAASSRGQSTTAAKRGVRRRCASTESAPTT